MLLDMDTRFEMIKVLVVDNQAPVRQGLRMRLSLEADLDVVATARDSVEATMLAQALVPDVIVIDVEMPGGDGMSTIEHLRRAAPGGAVVVLTLRDDPQTRARAERAGAHAFVEKQGNIDTLLREIRRVVS